MNNDFKTTSVFVYNNNALKSGHDLIINQGGTRSGKTYSILQLLFLKAHLSTKHYVISIVSRALPHLKLGAMRDFDNILLSYGIIPDSVKNKSENYYKIGNSTIEFFGADQADKVHGPQRDILFVNEANFIKEEIFDQLAVRTSGVILIDYNPSQRFWVHDSLIPNNKHCFIKTTYKDNQCLSEKQIQRIESKKNNENWWRVYGLGEIGTLEGCVFTNFRYGEFDTTIPYRIGLDFGFFPDPDSCNKVAIDHKRKKIYIDELIYSYNNGTDDLISQLNEKVLKKDRIVADSASPRTIEDIKRKGFNINRVSKIKTVADWLRDMQDYEMILTENSYNTEKELMNYIWSDKKAGVPIDAFNHSIDNIRYVFMDSKKTTGFKSRGGN